MVAMKLNRRSVLAPILPRSEVRFCGDQDAAVRQDSGVENRYPRHRRRISVIAGVATATSD
jgi:hypothetical protein